MGRHFGSRPMIRGDGQTDTPSSKAVAALMPRMRELAEQGRWSELLECHGTWDAALRRWALDPDARAHRDAAIDSLVDFHSELVVLVNQGRRHAASSLAKFHRHQGARDAYASCS